MAKHWAQVSESGGLWGLRFMFWVYRYCGRWAFTAFLYPVMVYFFVFNFSARRASLSYMRRLRELGVIPKAAHLAIWSYRHFLHCGRNILDKLAAWTGAFHYGNVHFHQRDDFLQLVDRGVGALIMVSHLGNQEVCRALVEESRRIRIHILVHTRHAENFNKMLQGVSGDSHIQLLQVTEFSPATAMILQDIMDAGEVVVIAGDRVPISGSRHSTVDFLGAPALFPQGPYILASVLRCPVYLMFCVRTAQHRRSVVQAPASDQSAVSRRPHYEIFFEHFADEIRLSRKQRDSELAVWAQHYADRLQHYTKLYPLQWNNFYDFWAQTQPTSHSNPNSKPKPNSKSQIQPQIQSQSLETERMIEQTEREHA